MIRLPPLPTLFPYTTLFRSHTLSAIQESVNNLPEATLVINGACSLTNTLKRETTVTYGVSVPLDQTSAVRDGTRCIHCKHQLE